MELRHQITVYVMANEAPATVKIFITHLLIITFKGGGDIIHFIIHSAVISSKEFQKLARSTNRAVTLIMRENK